MANYATEQTETWIFQANPKKYDIRCALSDPNPTLSWQVTRFHKEIMAGHNAIIWMAGKRAGIYAIGRVLSDPQSDSTISAADPCWIDLDQKDRTNYWVNIEVIRNLSAKPVMKGSIVAIPELSDLGVVLSPQGTNFQVREKEWAAIVDLLGMQV